MCTQSCQILGGRSYAYLVRRYQNPVRAMRLFDLLDSDANATDASNAKATVGAMMKGLDMTISSYS